MRVCAVIREHFALPESRELGLQVDFFDDLGGDSLDLAEVTMELEEEFAIEAPEEGNQPRKVGEFVAVVERCLVGAAT